MAKDKDPYDVKDIADKILEEWDSITKELNIKYLLVYGTCLGMYREGGYIKGDNDIDVWIERGNMPKVIALMKKHNFKVGRKWRTNQHFHKNGILFDVFIIPSFTEPFDEITYNGKPYKVPHPIEKYLEDHYGDWKTPSKRKGHD